jgi:hypothetical protein
MKLDIQRASEIINNAEKHERGNCKVVLNQFVKNLETLKN